MVLGLIQKKASTVKPKNRFLFTIILFSILNAIYGMVVVAWFAYTIHILKQPDRASDYNFTFCAVYLFLNSIAHFTFEEWVLSEGCYTMKYCETPSERTRTVMWLTRFVTGWGWIINTTYLCSLVLNSNSYAEAQSLRGPFLTGVLIGMVDLCSELRSGSWPFFAHHIFSMILMLTSAEFGYFEIGCLLFTPQQAYDKLVWPIFFFSRLRILRDRNDQMYLKEKEEEQMAELDAFTERARQRSEKEASRRQLSSHGPLSDSSQQNQDQQDDGDHEHRHNEPFFSVEETGVFHPVEIHEEEEERIDHDVKDDKKKEDNNSHQIVSVFIASQNSAASSIDDSTGDDMISPLEPTALNILAPPPQLPVGDRPLSRNQKSSSSSSRRGSIVTITPSDGSHLTSPNSDNLPTPSGATTVRIPEILIPGGYTPSVLSLTPRHNTTTRNNRDQRRRRSSADSAISDVSTTLKPWTRLPWGPASPYGKMATDQSFKRASAYHAHRHAIAIGGDHFVDDLIPSYATLSYWYCAMFIYYAILIRSTITILVAAYLGIFWGEIPTYWKIMYPLSTLLFIASDWDVYPLIYRRSYWSNGGKAVASSSSNNPSAVPEEPS